MMRLAPLLLAGMMLSLGACSSKPPAPTRSPEYERCLADLSKAHARFEPIPDFGEGKGCGVQEGVRLHAATIELSNPIAINCGLAEAILRFEREVVQPAAQRHFGQPVVRIHHMGAYACRPMTGRSDRLSLHALGKAIDVGSFELRDGMRVSVLRDWRSGGARQHFLREVAQKACNVFSLVLSPNHDAAHRDHLHLDIGPYHQCKV